jgi:hypothetical protein
MSTIDGRLFIDADSVGNVRVSIYGYPPKLDEDGSEVPDAFLMLLPEEAQDIAFRIAVAAEDASDTAAMIAGEAATLRLVTNEVAHNGYDHDDADNYTARIVRLAGEPDYE